jgi:hypothetical protein
MRLPIANADPIPPFINIAFWSLILILLFSLLLHTLLLGRDI